MDGVGFDEPVIGGGVAIGRDKKTIQTATANDTAQITLVRDTNKDYE